MTHTIAIVGAGGMGRMHAKNLSKIDGVKICGICDPDLAAAQALAMQHNTGAYESFGALLQSCLPEAVFICIPPFAHSGEATEAAQRGIHIFMEKPIGLSVMAAQSMVREVNASGVKTQVGYHCRFGGAVLELLEKVRSGKTGKPVLFNGRYECNSLHGPWWRDRNKAGSQILEQVIHTYDMAMFWMGIPVSATGMMDNLCHAQVPGYTLEDVSAAVLRFDTGALAAITATNCAVPMRWNNQFDIVFERLTAHFNDPNHAVFIDTSADKPLETRVDLSVNMYEEEAAAFVRMLEGKAPSACTIQKGFESLRLVEAVTRSARDGGALVSLK